MKNNSPKMELPSDHPLRKASWLWPEDYVYLYNCHAQFRRDFKLESVPAKAPFFITADKSYKLHVNGQFVCRGPARGYQESWPFDEVDVSRFLKKGRNWMSVEAYTPGISTFQYVHKGHAGFLCAGKWGKVEILSKAGEWMARRSLGRKIMTARYSRQIDFQEHFDARKEDRDWITKENYAYDATWKEHLYLPGDTKCHNMPQNRPPWEGLEPRGIPLMREELLAPAAATVSGEGKNTPGYEDRDNVSWLWAGEGSKIKKWGKTDKFNFKRLADHAELTMPPSGKGRFRTITLDIGKIIFGEAAVEVSGAKGGETLDFQHDQALMSGHPEFIPQGLGCLAAMANRLTLRKGKTSHEFYHPLGFRHLTIIARDTTTPLKIKVSVRSAGYPFEMKGAFRCSDETLNSIHDACRHTQQICASDAYVDTPWREQAQWWGDARVQAKNTFFLDGDARLLARGIRSISRQRTSQGLTYGHAPTCANSCILPDFALTWILTIKDYWWQTGDLEMLKEQWPGIKAVLDYFHTKDARSPEGLLRHDTRFWYFGDWSTLFKGEIPAFLNLWYLYTLRELEPMLRLAGMRSEAGDVKKDAERIQKLIMAAFYDKKKKLFRDGVDKDGSPQDRHSVHEQTLAIMCGLAPEAHGNMVNQRILPYLMEKEMDCATPSPFWATYTFEVAALAGLERETLAFIRKKWAPMLATGSTWEHYTYTPNGWSCSHAWTAHPSYHLPNIIAGLRQTAPNWRRIEIMPFFPEGMDSAETTLPSPHGFIRVSWKKSREKTRVSIELPNNVTAEVKLPWTKKTIGKKGKYDFETKTILN